MIPDSIIYCLIRIESVLSSNINKKRPISPEQVLRLFGTTTSSSSAPSNYNSYSNGVVRDRGRRSPASSPPSTTHHVNRVNSRFQRGSLWLLLLPFDFFKNVLISFVRFVDIERAWTWTRSKCNEYSWAIDENGANVQRSAGYTWIWNMCKGRQRCWTWCLRITNWRGITSRTSRSSTRWFNTWSKWYTVWVT